MTALRMPDVREKLLSQSAEPVGDTPQQFSAFMRSEHARWVKVIKTANVRIECDEEVSNKMSRVSVVCGAVFAALAVARVGWSYRTSIRHARCV